MPVISIIPAASPTTLPQHIQHTHGQNKCNDPQPETKRPANTGWTAAKEVEVSGFREAPLHTLCKPGALDAADEGQACKLGQLADKGEEADVYHQGCGVVSPPVVWHQALSAAARAARLQLQRQGWEDLAQALSTAEVGESSQGEFVHCFSVLGTVFAIVDDDETNRLHVLHI